LLITSNDSRVRIYNLSDRTLATKLKGYENSCSQISATFSDDGRHVITGSEDKRVYIWDVATQTSTPLPDTTHTIDPNSSKKTPCEYFEAASTIVTAAIFAPSSTRLLLAQSCDPVYDLCDPPPITLSPTTPDTASLPLSPPQTPPLTSAS